MKNKKTIMPQKYKRKIGGRGYVRYTKETLSIALAAVRKGICFAEASETYNIPVSTLWRKYHKKNPKKFGGQPILNYLEEQAIVDAITTAAEWGYPYEKEDIKCLVKSYLDRAGKTVKKFVNNMPGKDWCKDFLTRHSDVLKVRLAENIKRARAGVSRQILNEYFDRLAHSLEDVPPENLINYDETNFVDDPGRPKVVIRRTMKHAEKVCDSTKSAHSVMFAVTASGVMLPQYVVYKSDNLWSTWTQGGPEGCIYNRSKSGWFDQSLFEDWFFKVIVPYYRRQTGPKAIIGDNLASHLSVAVIRKCQAENIRFMFLPANSTHLTQPLDVACFRPIKIAWRKELKIWKNSNPGVLQKDHFPRILKKTMKAISISAEKNIKSGFEATGLCPLNRDKVLSKIPVEDPDVGQTTTLVAQAMTSLFKESRYKDPRRKRVQRKKLTVAPGESVTDQSLEDRHFSESETQSKSGSEEMLLNDGSDENEDFELPCFVTEQKNYLGENKLMEIQREQITKGDIAPEDFLLIEFTTAKKKKERFLGKVLECNKFIQCTFLRPSVKMSDAFIFPVVPDISDVSFDQIIKKMNPPEILRRGALKFFV